MNKDQKIFAKEDDVNFRKPMEGTDGVEKMPKGQEIIYIDGPWFRVKKNDQTGWVHADYVSETNPSPAPTISTSLFVVGKPNLFGDAATVEVRRVINDEFGGNRDKDHLNCTEYVQYAVKTKLGIDISWPVKSGRNGGKWWKIFQDAGLFKVLDAPQVNCAMCFTAGISSNPATNAIGHVAFVEGVGQDGSIKISEANWPPSGQLPQGQYGTRTIAKDRWQNVYKAKFVAFV
jgi:surface antigen